MGGRIIRKEITELSLCEVFVFGSNLAGHHTGGAARKLNAVNYINDIFDNYMEDRPTIQ